MSVLVNKNTKVLVQGLGKAGLFHALQMLEYGTQIVGGVRPGEGGQEKQGIRLFDSVAEGVRMTGADTTVVYVPAPGCRDAILEADAAGIRLCVVITEGIPEGDMIQVYAVLKRRGSQMRIIGPNCPGIITPGECKIGIMPGYIHKPGKVGVISRSGTLTYEAVWQLTQRGIGQSTCIGIGGDPMAGTTHVGALELLNADPGTEAIILIGEIGGTGEEEAAAWIKANVRKPVVGFIGGQTAPPGRRMGHAGAIISGGTGKAEDKIRALRAAGVEVAMSPADIAATLVKVTGF